ncbi:uncharacterized protein PHACADRAFT_167073 [Phanerochaete carnosa HHB-10118-sp]|uniref:AB hydrolase-1 domain-containing protein n=1 Tax=Phanerochaete carnosa (strain HHB-10118-sp) TaxID=650164 RepID=K5VEY0_PHACS|nr:uncharacterized protein PHACADRAFT_167073 [Phanerochaete carnosa HHB-10118-sp]EKM49718.1 hypothetical protein PHACADRAFT_167073 [Phanerochaete carnosa HHB-10118-sp]
MIARIYRSFFYVGLLYSVIIALLTIPAVQRHATFKHALRFPFYTKYDLPEKYGLAPGKTLNTYFTTPDNCTLGAWFALADPSTVIDAIKTHPTALILHGAAGTRAASFRVDMYRGFTSRLQANVFAPNYRGFGDSTGSPDGPGLELDTYTSWKWLLERGARPEDIVIVGHSLGTGIAGQLAKRLAAEDLRPRGIVLLAPFSSVSRLIESYDLWGIPILQPLQSFPWGLKLLKHIARIEFDTLAAIQDFNAPTLIAHAQDDTEVPHAHSKTLIDALLEPLLPGAIIQLPNAPGKTLTTEEFFAFRKQQEERNLKRGQIVKTTDVLNFGMIEEFKGLRAPITYVETFWGSHGDIGAQEGVQDQMAKLFGLGIYRAEYERESDSVVDRVLHHLVE